MQLIHPAIDLDFASIPIDPDWNVGECMEQKMHRIHAYPAKFPAFFASKAIDYAQSQRIPTDWVGDVFCGCGTVAYESLRRNASFWGCDINPVATLIAKVKSCRYQPNRLIRYFESVLQMYTKTSFDNQLLFPRSAMARITYWFEPDQISNLSRLLQSINKTVPVFSPYRQFFLCAFSSILKASSRWLTKSIKPQIDPHKKKTSVIDMFVKQCQFMFQANAESDLPKRTSACILNGSIFSLEPDRPLNLVITSPPYVTSYEYADLHQLSTIWLGFADDYRTLRQGTVGSCYNEFNFQKEVARLNRTGNRIVFSLFNKDKYQARAIAKYYLDMQEITKKVSKILAPKGMSIFVIGDTEYKGIRIENAKHLVESLYSGGFKSVFVTKRKISKKILTPYRDDLGRFTVDTVSRRVYSEEFIVVGRK